MIYAETKLKGAYRIDMQPVFDERGFFARSWSLEEFRSHGLTWPIAQCNVSFNEKRGTLRGMHYQVAPYEEAKLVRCTRGAIHDVIIDLRPDSPTHRQWTAIELSADNHTMLYIPPGFAHGFLTIEDHSEVFYQMSECYHPECSRGVRWDDPAFEIAWPKIDHMIISEKDSRYQDYSL